MAVSVSGCCVLDAKRLGISGGLRVPPLGGVDGVGKVVGAVEDAGADAQELVDDVVSEVQNIPTPSLRGMGIAITQADCVVNGGTWNATIGKCIE